MALTARKPWFKSLLAPFCVHAWVFSGFSGFLPLSKKKKMLYRLIADTKLSLGVRKSVRDCVALQTFSGCTPVFFQQEL